MTTLPIPQTLLPLLEAGLNRALAERGGRGPITLERVALRGDTLGLELRTPRLAGLVGGVYRLEMKVVRSAPTETVLAPSWDTRDGLTRLTGLGAKMLPRRLLNDLLGRLVGQGLRVEGEEVVVEHLPLLRRLAETR